MQTIGERVKIVRKANSLTQEQLSSILAVSRPYITNIELNNKIPSKPIIKLFCHEFNISEEWLCVGGDKYDMVVSKKNG